MQRKKEKTTLKKEWDRGRRPFLLLLITIFGIIVWRLYHS